MPLSSGACLLYLRTGAFGNVPGCCHILLTNTSRHLHSRVPCLSSSFKGLPSTQRQNLVILGTGWGSYSVLKNLKKRKRLRNLFNIIVISPRNHFLFTPLLASTTVGTLEFRSIIEPVRNTGFRDEHHFHLADAVGLDVESKVLKCASVLEPSMAYDVPYDKLVIGVGAVSNDFNVPGVKEHAFFLKVRREGGGLGMQVFVGGLGMQGRTARYAAVCSDW